MEKLNIYPKREEYEQRSIKKLHTTNISQNNKKLITEFQNYQYSLGNSTGRIAKLTTQMLNICRWLKGKELNKLLKKDVIEIVAYINNMPEKAESTKADYKRMIKQFFKWHEEEDLRLQEPNPEIYQKNKKKYYELKQLQLEVKKFYKYIKEIKKAFTSKKADPKTIITDEEIRIVINSANTRDKALISCLHEWGLRTAEFLNLKIGDVIIKENHAEIRVPDGKTGERIVFSYKSLPYLLKYLDVHPYKDSDTAYLWLTDSQKNRNNPLKHRGGQKILDRNFQRAGIKKKHNLHWFRHSRATILAPKMTEALLCKYMGWKLGSPMVKIYVHLCNKQMEDVFLGIHGIKSEEEENKPSKCVCGSLNVSSERYCHKCYRPLSVETALVDKEILKSETGKTVQALMEIMQNPTLKKEFEGFKLKKKQEEFNIYKEKFDLDKAKKQEFVESVKRKKTKQ